MPGRGVKVCPKCSTEQGPRTLICKNESCKHNFFEGRENEVKVEKDNSANVIGLRRPTMADPQTVPQEVIVQHSSDPDIIGATKLPMGYGIILVPGCKFGGQLCPITPKDSTNESIIEWVQALKKYELVEGGQPHKYSRNAIRYMAESYWPQYKKGMSGVNIDYIRAVAIINKYVEPYLEELRQGYEF